jgi:type IX secretion system PorP/SprF family membrane protein
MGMQGEVRYHQLRLDGLQLVDQGDQLFSDEPGLTFSPNFGVGVHLTNDKYSVNLSFPRFLNEKLSPFEGTRSEWSSIGRPVYFGADLKLNAARDLEIVPSIQMALSKGLTPWIEIASHFTYMDKMGAGILYRFDHTLGVLISYQYRERVVFGYSYDISLGFPVYNPGTHEIFLGYNLPFNRFKTVSPRQF